MVQPLFRVVELGMPRQHEAKAVKKVVFVQLAQARHTDLTGKYRA